LGGTYEEVPEIWNEASALYHVDKHTPPTLFLSSIYSRFLAGRKDYIDKLKPFGINSETYFLDRAPHSFWLFNPWYETTMKYVTDFLKRTL
jgi:pectinesterase